MRSHSLIGPNAIAPALARPAGDGRSGLVIGYGRPSEHAFTTALARLRAAMAGEPAAGLLPVPYPRGPGEPGQAGPYRRCDDHPRQRDHRGRGHLRIRGRVGLDAQEVGAAPCRTREPHGAREPQEFHGPIRSPHTSWPAAGHDRRANSHPRAGKVGGKSRLVPAARGRGERWGTRVRTPGRLRPASAMDRTAAGPARLAVTGTGPAGLTARMARAARATPRRGTGRPCSPGRASRRCRSECG